MPLNDRVYLRNEFRERARRAAWIRRAAILQGFCAAVTVALVKSFPPAIAIYPLGLLGLLTVTVIATVIHGRRNWRCPRCDTALPSRVDSISGCGSCGAAF